MSTAAAFQVGAVGDDRHGSRRFGAHAAIVTDIVDPEHLGRIEVKFLWLGADGDGVRPWATLLSPYADDDQGIQILPEVGTEVVVIFEHGDLRRPYIVGCAWNGRESPPVTAERANNLRVWKTRSGSQLEFDDTAGAAKVTVSMQSGHQLVLDDGAQQVELRHQNGCVITITADGRVEIQANQSVDISAPLVNVKSPMAKFDGVITCKTLLADIAISSPSYTPGAGNIW